MPEAQDLGGPGWLFGHVPPRPWASPPPADMDRVEEWLPGLVPGEVRADLLALGRIPDPFYGQNLRESLWVEERDWWYRRPVHLQREAGERVFLVFEGVDYRSAVFWDGHPLGQHEGMFARQVYEVTDLIPPGEAREADLAVRLWAPAGLPRLKRTARQRLLNRAYGLLGLPEPPFPDRIATLKAQFGFGWDFAPPLRTEGIWADVGLVTTGPARLVHAWAHTARLEGADPARGQAERAEVHLHLEVDALDATPAWLRVTLQPRGSGEGYQKEVPLSLRAGRQSLRLPLTLAGARLWQPWDRGEPALYEVTVALHLEEGRPPSDVAQLPLGVRTVARRPNPGAPPDALPWTFVVNGEPVFFRGANWVPADALPGRLRAEDYRDLLERLRSLGANGVRVWGGGLREKRAFYEACDELGLLVWQEFPFACLFFGAFPSDRAYRRLVESEVRGIVRAVRPHPCVVLWCGGNEFSPQHNRDLVALLERIAGEEDGTRPFQPASPAGGDSHNWLVWHGRAPVADYRKDQALFASEFGLAAPPAVESLREFLPPEDLWPPGPAWAFHHAEWAKLARYAAPWLPEGGEPDLEAFVRASQAAQAWGLQVAVEHFRRRKPGCSGTAFWQFNEPWPAVCWSVLDFFRRPKAAWETLRRVYGPLLVSLEYPLRRYRPGDRFAAEVWVVNDRREQVDGATLSVWVGERRIQSLQVDVPGDSSVRVGRVETVLRPGEAEACAFLERDGECLAWNRYDLHVHDAGRQALGPWLRQHLARWLLR
jgi:beta-mannosidase